MGWVGSRGRRRNGKERKGTEGKRTDKNGRERNGKERNGKEEKGGDEKDRRGSMQEWLKRRTGAGGEGEGNFKMGTTGLREELGNG